MQNYKVMCCSVIGLTIIAGRWSGWLLFIA